MKTRIHAAREIWNDQIAIYIGSTDEHGYKFVAKPPIMEPIAPGAVAGACLELSVTDAQLLMDELWRCGLRPSEGAGSAGSLAATEHHLKDMQTIAMGLLHKDGMA